YHQAQRPTQVQGLVLRPAPLRAPDDSPIEALDSLPLKQTRPTGRPRLVLALVEESLVQSRNLSPKNSLYRSSLPAFAGTPRPSWEDSQKHSSAPGSVVRPSVVRPSVVRPSVVRPLG